MSSFALEDSRFSENRGEASRRVMGHFGELLQGRLGPEGPLALITLPCPKLEARANRAPGAFALEQAGPPVLTPDQAAVFLHLLGIPVEGRFRLSLGMPPGCGCGASTSRRGG